MLGCVLVMPVCIFGGPNPLAPSHPQHSHVTLGRIDAVVQRLNGHPTYGETPLGESRFEGLGEEKGPVRWFREAGPGMEPEGRPGPYHCLLHINFLPPRKAKVSNLGGQILSDQHISGSQVPVDELQAWSEVSEDWGEASPGLLGQGRV